MQTYYMGAKPIRLNLEGKQQHTRKDGLTSYILAEADGKKLVCSQWADGYQNIVWLSDEYLEMKYGEQNG